jgi:hypothetical protein
MKILLFLLLSATLRCGQGQVVGWRALVQSAACARPGHAIPLLKKGQISQKVEGVWGSLFLLIAVAVPTLFDTALTRDARGGEAIWPSLPGSV